MKKLYKLYSTFELWLCNMTVVLWCGSHAYNIYKVYIHGYIDGYIDGNIDGNIVGYIDGYIDGYINGCWICYASSCLKGILINVSNYFLKIF